MSILQDVHNQSISMIALAKYTQQQNAVIKSDLALRAKALSPLPLVPEFRRESDVETSYSNVIATLKGKLADVPENEAVFLTLRIKHGNDVAIAYLPHIYANENFSIPVQAQWYVPHGGLIALELLASSDCTLRNAEAEILCIDAPKPTTSEGAVERNAPQARNGSASIPTTIVCAPVIVFEGSDYISLEPGSNPGWVKILLVNGE